MVPKSIAAMLPVGTRKPDSSLGTRLATSQPFGVRSFLGLAMIRGGGATELFGGKGARRSVRNTPH